MDLYGDSGQSTVEWLAIMCMIIALGGVLAATVPSVGDTIVGVFEKLVKSVAG